MTIGPEFLAGLERRAIVLAVVIAVIALFVPSGGWNAAAGVVGGALMASVSYFGIRRGVDGLMGALSGGAGALSGLSRALIMLVGRYALLALIAYVMISRLRLSPVGLLVGVSVIPLAAAIEALVASRGIRKIARRDHGKV